MVLPALAHLGLGRRTFGIPPSGTRVYTSPRYRRIMITDAKRLLPGAGSQG